MTRALVFAGDIWHPAETVRHGLAALGAEEFDFEFTDAPPDCPAEWSKKFRLVVLARANISSTTDRQPWLDSDTANSFADFVTQGGSLLVVHAGTSRYEILPAMNALIGGSFVRHPEQCAVTIEAQAENCLTEQVQSFEVQDEHYFMKLDDSRAEVFLRSSSAHGVQPAGWTRLEGCGRVCVLTPGHNLEVWLHPSFQRLLTNALRWTAKMN